MYRYEFVLFCVKLWPKNEGSCWGSSCLLPVCKISPNCVYIWPVLLGRSWIWLLFTLSLYTCLASMLTFTSKLVVLVATLCVSVESDTCSLTDTCLRQVTLTFASVFQVRNVQSCKCSQRRWSHRPSLCPAWKPFLLQLRPALLFLWLATIRCLRRTLPLIGSFSLPSPCLASDWLTVTLLSNHVHRLKNIQLILNIWTYWSYFSFPPDGKRHFSWLWSFILKMRFKKPHRLNIVFVIVSIVNTTDFWNMQPFWKRTECIYHLFSVCPLQTINDGFLSQ